MPSCMALEVAQAPPCGWPWPLGRCRLSGSNSVCAGCSPSPMSGMRGARLCFEARRRHNSKPPPLSALAAPLHGSSHPPPAALWALPGVSALCGAMKAPCPRLALCWNRVQRALCKRWRLRRRGSSTSSPWTSGVFEFYRSVTYLTRVRCISLLFSHRFPIFPHNHL